MPEMTRKKTDIKTKKLLNVMETKIILLYTPTTLCCLRHGLQLTTVHQLIENERFVWFLRKWQMRDVRRIDIF